MELIHCKNLKIEYIKFNIIENCNCYDCIQLQIYERLIDDININQMHSFCIKDIIPISYDKIKNLNIRGIEFIDMPIILEKPINKLILDLMIYLKEFITIKKFIFIKNNEFNNIYDKDIIYINTNNLLNINYYIIKYLIQEKIISQCNDIKISYFIEYILTPFKIKDKNIYNKIKSIFKKEFINV